MKAVMSWGKEPSDVDLHIILIGEDGHVICHSYYSTKKCDEHGLKIELDRDNTNVS